MFGIVVVKSCRVNKTLDSLAHLNNQRWFYAELIGRYPFFNFIVMAILMILLSGLAVFTKVSEAKRCTCAPTGPFTHPHTHTLTHAHTHTTTFLQCGTLRSFSIDKETQNYIKSDSPVTQSYDALAAAVSDNSQNNNWPYRRTTYMNHSNPLVENSLSIIGDGETEFDSNGDLIYSANGLGVVLSDGLFDAHGRSLAKREGVTDRTVTFVYVQRNRPSNVFNNANMWAIHAFEERIYGHSKYNTFCRRKSYYSGKTSDQNKCAKQASSITGWFFSDDANGNPQLLNIDDTLKGMAQSGVAIFMDLYFSLDYRQSNLTRSSFAFEYPTSQENDDAFKHFLIHDIVPLAQTEDAKLSDMRFLYYDTGMLFDWEVDLAVLSDAKFATLSFLTVLIFVWIHTKSIIISVMGMLGVLASIPITMFIYTSIIGIDHMSILNFLSLFVIMGIGADDIFVFFDTYDVVANEHPDIEDDIPLRTGLTFRRAGSAMLVTSVSTAASFFANWVSSLPVIREFGLFMGLVVVVNFVIVLTYFPSITICEHKWCSCIISSRKRNPDAKMRKNFKNSKSNSFRKYGGDGDGDGDDDDDNESVDPSDIDVETEANSLPVAPRAKAGGPADGDSRPGLLDFQSSNSKKGGGSSSSSSSRRFFGSVKNFGDSVMGPRSTVDYTREDNWLTADEGWTWTDIFFHNTWAPFIYKMRHVIVLVVTICVVLSAVSAFLLLVPADKPPSFFPETHNLGMLEVVNSDYVASTSMDVDAADAVAWGVMDSGGGTPSDSGSGGGGGSGGSGAVCPTVGGKICSGNGRCNQVIGKCQCYTGYDGADCSLDTTTGLTSRNIVADPLVISAHDIAPDFTNGDDVTTVTLLNPGETNLNFYLYHQDAQGSSIQFDDDASGLPNWMTLSKYSGSVDAGKTATLTITLKPQVFVCPDGRGPGADDCRAQYTFHLSDSGPSSDPLSFRINLEARTNAPSNAPSSAPSSSEPSGAPSLAPSSAPSTSSPSSSPSSAPSDAPSLPPSRAPSDSPSEAPSRAPSMPPSAAPSRAPSRAPSEAPSGAPSEAPSRAPSQAPSRAPSEVPSIAPTQPHCTNGIKDADESDEDCGGDDCPPCAENKQCSVWRDCVTQNCAGGTCGSAPSAFPSVSPSQAPSVPPTTFPSLAPSLAPSENPSMVPSEAPSGAPSSAPTISNAPSQAPSNLPSDAPSVAPTNTPTAGGCTDSVKNGEETDVDCGGDECPRCAVDKVCSVDSDCSSFACLSSKCVEAPSSAPSVPPSAFPSGVPSAAPSFGPTVSPSLAPSAAPSQAPSGAPTNLPSNAPSVPPSGLPSVAPSEAPSAAPSEASCTNGSKDVGESDTDCGGDRCPQCAVGKDCNNADDCESLACFDGTCADFPSAAPTSPPSQFPSGAPSGAPSMTPSSPPTKSPSSAPSSNPTSKPSVSPSSAPSFAPTEAPSAPPSTQPSSMPSISPTLQPSRAPSAHPSMAPSGKPSPAPSSAPSSALPSSAPSSQPTSIDCNNKYCNYHGRCVENTADTGTNEVCQCFPGYVGTQCENVETVEKATDIVVDVYWGVTGIDRKDTSEDFLSGSPIYDENFDIGDSGVQVFLRDVCKKFRATTNLLVFPDGSDWYCTFELLDYWLNVSGSATLPIPKPNLIANLTTFFANGYVRDPSKVGRPAIKTFKHKNYIGMDQNTGDVKWVRIGVDTTIDEGIAAAQAEALQTNWNNFMGELHEGAPAALGTGEMASFLWVRVTTELMLIRSTITAWAISNLSAFVSIVLFTKSLYIATVTTLCIFFIVLSLLWYMVVIMNWSLGAMEALSITIFVGMSCDYCLHIAHAFMHSHAKNAHLKVREALAIIGNSVLGAAVTTFGSCIFLLLCSIVFFFKMGIIIAINTICSVWFALVFFPALLTLFDNGAEAAKQAASSRSLRDLMPTRERGSSNFEMTNINPNQDYLESKKMEEGGGKNDNDMDTKSIKENNDKETTSLVLKRQISSL